MNLFYELIIYFTLFSIGGWICETIYCTIVDKKLAYRGFLNGPVCPVYGFGGLAVVYLLAPFQYNIVLLFIMGMIVATIIEYITSYILEMIFHTRWWDYSSYPLNINGRVCLPYSIMFGILSIVAVYTIYPPAANIINKLDDTTKPSLAITLLILFLIDFFATVWGLFKLNGTLSKMKESRTELISELLKVEPDANKLEKFQFLKENRRPLIEIMNEAQEKLTPEEVEIVESFADKEQRFQMYKGFGRTQMKRILHAFPNVKSKKFNFELSELKVHTSNIRKKLSRK